MGTSDLGGQPFAEALTARVESVDLARRLDPRIQAAAAAIIRELDEYSARLTLYPVGRPVARVLESHLRYYNIQGNDLLLLVQVLGTLGYAKAFFAFAIPRNDTGLKDYLLQNGVFWDTVVQHHDFDLYDGAEFVRGFVMGLGASFAAILVALKDLFDFGMDALQDPKAAWLKVSGFLDGLRSLRADALIEIGKEEWRKLNADLSRALFDLRFDRAGYILGKLGGDMWQLITGVAALRKLPGMTLRLARRFASLFVEGARRSAAAIRVLIDLLAQFGRAIADLPRIGAAALAAIAENATALAGSLEKGLLAFTEPLSGRLFVVVPAEAVAMAGAGSDLARGVLLAQEAQGGMKLLARVKVTFGDVYERVSSVLNEYTRLVRRAKPLTPEFLQLVDQAEKLAVDSVREWKATLQRIVKESQLPLNPAELGTWLHAHMETALPEFAQTFSKLAGKVGAGFVGEAEVSIRALASKLSLPKVFLKRAETPLLDFLKAQPEVLAGLGLKDEKSIVGFLKGLGYDNPSKTLIGELISDGVLVSDDAKRLISIDWTSGLGRVRFASAYKGVLEAGKNLTQAEMLKLAKEFLGHGLREYVVRDAVLAFVFEGWETRALEATYFPFSIR